MKDSNIDFSVIYGDLRQELLIELLAKSNYKIKVFGFNRKFDNENIIMCNSYENAIKNSNVIIGPIPFSKNGKDVFTIYDYLPTLDIENLFKLCKDKLIIAGVISKSIKDIANKYKVSVFDLFSLEEMSILNSIPTSEGAIQIAMQESNITLHGSNILILGYGHCGKTLAYMLKGIGANVYIYTKEIQDVAYSKIYGFKSIDSLLFNYKLSNFDFIFNTVPEVILTKEILKVLKPGCIIVDLASAPGGTDFKSAAEYNIKALFCPSLPGRVAPKTVASIMEKLIIDTVKKEGLNL